MLFKFKFKFIRKIRLYIGLSLLFIFTAQCGGKGTSACAPNFDGTLSILMTRLPDSINQYEITVCDSNRTNNRDISVYGIFDEADIPGMFLSSRVRAPHIQDSSDPTDTFYVTFNNDDRWFVIYEDDISGNYSNQVELARGEFR